MRALVLLLAGCSYVYEGAYTADVTTTIDGVTTETVELVELAEGDLGSNERRLRRELDAPCELTMFKRGGYGLRFVAGTTCTRDAEAWTLTAGAAPDANTDVLVIELAWDLPGRTATETLRIAR